MTRKLLTIVLSVTVLWLLATVSAPVSVGQDLVPLFPPSELLTPHRNVVPKPTPIEALKIPVLGDPAHGEPRLDCQESHWLVSVRNCKQHCRRCAQCCDLDFFHANRDCCTNRVSQADFRRGLRPGVPVCIVVHGSYVTGQTVKEDCKLTFHWLRQAAPHLPLHIIFFTWPSEGPFAFDAGNALTSPVPGIDVAILGRRAEMNGTRLARLMNIIPAENPISLIGHSHGARIVASALHLTAGGSLQDLSVPRGDGHRIRAILAAAAIDHDWLTPERRYGRALGATESVINLKSRMDWALWFYPLRRPFSGDSLGRRGFTEHDLRQLGKRRTQISEVDVTRLVGVGHIWPHFYSRPEIAETILPFVYFTD